MRPRNPNPARGLFLCEKLSLKLQILKTKKPDFGHAMDRCWRPFPGAIPVTEPGSQPSPGHAGRAHLKDNCRGTAYGVTSSSGGSPCTAISLS